MEIRKIDYNKKEYLELLLLADEQEILNTAQLMAEDLVRCIQENQ